MKEVYAEEIESSSRLSSNYHIAAFISLVM